MTTFTATYSAEDNKLRLYTNEWVERGLYLQLTNLGFKHAKKQSLFVAPKWTPQREDICIELAGDITAEQTTLIERAEAKAKRLDTLAVKRASQADAFFDAANKLSERFSNGQPILVGHHSEASARRDQARIHSALKNGSNAMNAIEYWQYRAEGVKRHANRKNNDDVRARRIKALLVELRRCQRSINHAYSCLDIWHKVKAKANHGTFAQLVKHYAGGHLDTGPIAPYYTGDSLWSQLDKKTLTPDEVVEKCLTFHEQQTHSLHTARWINHILNRLAFDNAELGETEHFTGTITAAILQTFARTHGAQKPKATKQGDQWQLTSSVPLPLHISDSKALVLTAKKWCELMQASGYEVPAPKPKQPPLLNFEATQIKAKSWGNVKTFRQIPLTKTQYSALHSDYRGAKLSACGQFRFKVCQHPEQLGYRAEWCAVFLTDSKVHRAVNSSAVICADTAQEASE